MIDRRNAKGQAIGGQIPPGEASFAKRAEREARRARAEARAAQRDDLPPGRVPDSFRPPKPRILQLPNNWQPRDYQRPLWDYLEGGGKRAFAVWHRRAGKDDVALHWSCVASQMRVGVVWHMLPEAMQARKAVWDAINPWSGLRRIDEAFPAQLRAVTREQDMAIRFNNGSLWQLVGSDNYNSLVGSPPVGVVFSEFALADPAAWGYLRPILAENGGWSVFITTPRGRNHASTFYEAAQDDPTWFAELLPATETTVFTPEQLELERTELIREYGPDEGEARYRQEYLCSFSAGVQGAYYGHEMEAAEKEGRIGRVLHDPTLPVHTAWDLGIGDATAIWAIQLAGPEVRCIDYIESSGVGIDWYCRELDRRPWRWGQHIVPHDAEARELGTGKSRIEVMRSLGLHRTTVVPQQRLDDGINAARMMLPRTWFDRDKCRRGIEALQNYRRSWDEARRTYSDRPRHDFASHGCLTADAEVLTERGFLPIAQVVVGDRAWTPAGFAEVTHAGPVKQVSQLVEIETSDGAVLCCTPEHKILTGRGFVQADALRYADRLFRGDEWPIRLTALYSRVTSIGFRAAITDATAGVGRGRQTCIGRFGNIITARCRMVVRSIIGMAIPSTMTSPILNAAASLNTNASMRWSDTSEARCGRPDGWHESALPNGTAAMKGANGIAAMASAPGKPERGMTAFANNAAKFFVRLGLRAPSGAISIARWKICDSGEANQWVFDLTIENHACYQANGILVSNSDAFRYFALSGVKNAGRPKPLKYPDLAVV